MYINILKIPLNHASKYFILPFQILSIKFPKAGRSFVIMVKISIWIALVNMFPKCLGRFKRAIEPNWLYHCVHTQLRKKLKDKDCCHKLCSPTSF